MTRVIYIDIRNLYTIYPQSEKKITIFKFYKKLH